MSEAKPDLEALAAVSSQIGGDPDLVQGGGGNSSLKRGGVLWIKASGTWLARAEREEIFVALDLARLRRQIDAGMAEPTAGCFDAGAGRRPSIETTLHALMAHPVVLHSHAVNSIAWAVRREPMAALEERLGGLAWALVPYRRPGLPLTEAVREVLAGGAADVLILANHGLVVGADDAWGAARLTHEVERSLGIRPRPAPAPETTQLAPFVDGGDWRLPGDPLVHAIATDPACRRIAARGPLYPDHVVFLDAELPLLAPGEAVPAVLDRHLARAGRRPAYLAVAGAGVVVAADISPGAEEMLRCLARVLLRLPADAALNHLGAPEIAELVDWEAEQYRRSLDGAAENSKGESE